MERKVCFTLDVSNWGGGGGGAGQTPVQRLTPLTDNQWARASIGRERGLHTETAQAALTITLKLIIGGLTSVILIVLSTVNLQFQGRFVPLSLRPVLGIVAACVMATVWSSCSSLLPPDGVSSIHKIGPRIWLRIFSIALEKELKVLDFA